MKLTKSSYTIEHEDEGSTWYPGKDILQQKTCGNLQHVQTLLKAYKLQHSKDFSSPT